MSSGESTDPGVGVLAFLLLRQVARVSLLANTMKFGLWSHRNVSVKRGVCILVM